MDAPSGTAKMLLDSINETLGYKVVHGRSGIKPREKKGHWQLELHHKHDVLLRR
ncbi:hypothetical protein [Lactococcus petauri]|uniref:hypothetical protein n=1 Tax=Lactococcus petauri TaxID=1940789 RepID=UPI00254DFF0A|nr:hypothetical protein [Lactococcus petauri]